MELNELNLSEEQISAITKYVQSVTDKVRTDYSQRLKVANDELAKYKPKEKSEEEKQYEERLSALEAREKELTAKEQKQALAEKLKAKNIPVELADYLNVGDDVDATIEKVGAALGNYFLGESHKPAEHANNTGISKEQFRKMGYMERAKLQKDNPTLFNLLSR